MRILIFHGYLLDGTGSNVYNARLAEALVELGHEVHLLCQDRHPERLSFVDAVGTWERGELGIRPVGRGAPGRPARCTVYRPEIGELLPVYVADRYEGMRAQTFARCTDPEIAGYIDANVAAVRQLAELVRPQAALANHLVMSPVILARGLADSGVPYAVKIHGSALEYTVKPHPERFLGLAREGLRSARGILVGSSHTARSLWDALAEETVVRRTRLGPPGVDIHRFAPNLELDRDGRMRCDRSGLRTLVARLHQSAQDSASRPPAEGAFGRDDAAAAEAVEGLLGIPADDTGSADPTGAAGRANAGGASTGGPLVAFVGKLIVSKGIDLLIAAWPLVLEQAPQATLVVVGFGSYRSALERLADALTAGDLGLALEIARAGRDAEEGGDQGSANTSMPLRHLQAFLRSLRGSPRKRYLEAARALPERLVLTGRLDHEELAYLLPACEALIVPSTFPESFGMVAAEGAACAALPVSAAHSGLAEVSAVLAQAVPAPAAHWLTFPIDDHAVPALAERISSWLGADPVLRAQTRAQLVATVRERWSWEGVARGVLAAARGELDSLSKPTAA